MNFGDVSSLLFRGCLSTFGESILYQSKGEEVAIKGILSQPYLLVKENSFDTRVSGSHIVLEFEARDLPFKPTLQDKIQVKQGAWFKVNTIEPNHQGQIKMTLNRIEKGVLGE